MLKINYINLYDKSNAYKSTIRYILKKAYKHLKIFDFMIINVILVDDVKIREMNKQYRNIDQETDVLSFENADGLSEIGDIFISIDKTLKQAENYKHSFKRELAFLSLHGFLHCLGYDHLTEDEEKEMFSLQDMIIDNTKFKR